MHYIYVRHTQQFMIPYTLYPVLPVVKPKLTALQVWALLISVIVEKLFREEFVFFV